MKDNTKSRLLAKNTCAIFFNNIKGAAASSIARVFITGVTPVTMYDLANGFNISTNYSLAPEFNEMVGFTEGGSA